MGRTYSSIGVGLLVLLAALPLSSTSAAAQTPPPIQGVTGTIATEGTIDSEHKAGRGIAEGAAYVGRAVKKLLPFGGKGTNPLDAFTEGSRVVVRDARDGSRAADRVDAGEEGRKSTTEGVVVDVNRKRQQITVRFAGGKTQALRLIDRASAEKGSADDTSDAATQVVVSLADQTGARVDYDFKRVS